MSCPSLTQPEPAGAVHDLTPPPPWPACRVPPARRLLSHCAALLEDRTGRGRREAGRRPSLRLRERTRMARSRRPSATPVASPATVNSSLAALGRPNRHNPPCSDDPRCTPPRRGARPNRRSWHRCPRGPARPLDRARGDRRMLGARSVRCLRGATPTGGAVLVRFVSPPWPVRPPGTDASVHGVGGLRGAAVSQRRRRPATIHGRAIEPSQLPS